jgi:hypothetical protein
MNEKRERVPRLITLLIVSGPALLVGPDQLNLLAVKARPVLKWM